MRTLALLVLLLASLARADTFDCEITDQKAIGKLPNLCDALRITLDNKTPWDGPICRGDFVIVGMKAFHEAEEADRARAAYKSIIRDSEDDIVTTPLPNLATPTPTATPSPTP